MDPLSVATSIDGLLTTSAEVSKLFLAFKGGDEYAQMVHEEIHDFRIVLFRLQKYLLSDPINLTQTPMIDLDQIGTLLPGCMYTLSVLEREVKRLLSRPEALQGVWWAMTKSRLTDLVQGIQNHKGVICCVLATLSREWQGDAMDSIRRLQREVAESIRKHAGMARQLHSVTITDGSDLSPALSIAAGVETTRSVHSVSSARFDFATTLKRSQVSRREPLGRTYEHNMETTQGIAPSIQQTLPAFSGISRDEVLNYGTYFLPISPQELYDPIWYMTPGQVVPLEPNIPEVPTYITKGFANGFAEALVNALSQSNAETAKYLANRIPWDNALAMSAVYPTLIPDPLSSFGEVLDSLSLFKLWLQCGGDPEAKNQHGQTAIKKALESEDWRLFKLLARNGSDINFTWDSKTVLHHVLQVGSEAFVNGLCEDIEEEDIAEIAPIGYDLERKREQAVEVLLKLGADINAADGWEKTALHWFSEGGHKGVVEFLLSHGADIHAKDMWGTTSLHWASEGGHKAVAEVLVSNSADVNVRDRWGMTAICYASEGGHRGVVEVLLRHRADIGSKDKWEKTTLHCASWRGDKGVVEILLSHGADIHAKDMWGTTPLHWASEGGHKGVVNILLRRGVDINAKDRWGMTALHHASKGGHKGVVKTLLRHGADINAKDKSEDTALHLALESGHNGVIELLSSRGADKRQG